MSKINQTGGRAMTDNTQEIDEILDTLAEKSADSDSRLGYVDAYVFAEEAKQAITSLIKELVAEAKPSKYKTDGSTKKPNLAIEYNMAIDEFEQNLLKALEQL